MQPLVFDGEAVDAGILELVHYLIANGFHTFASCQGKSPSQPHHAFNMPIVRCEVEPNNDIVRETVKRVLDVMHLKWTRFSITTETRWDHEGYMRAVYLDVMLIKRITEEFDINKHRK